MDDSELIALKNRYTASSKGDPDIDRIRKENFLIGKVTLNHCLVCGVIHVL